MKRGSWLGTGTTINCSAGSSALPEASSAATCSCRPGSSGHGSRSCIASGVRIGRISREK